MEIAITLAFLRCRFKVGATVCPVCGKELPTPCPKCGSLLFDRNVKFCPECGESLVKKCANCGVKIEGNPKFCPECGKKI